MNKQQRRTIRNILMVFVFINFIALILALTNWINPNPLKDYRLALGISFILLAGTARRICQSCQEKEGAGEKVLYKN